MKVSNVALFDRKYRFVPKERLVLLGADIKSIDVREHLLKAALGRRGNFRTVSLVTPPDENMSNEMVERTNRGFWVIDDESDPNYDPEFVAVEFEEFSLVFVPFGDDLTAGDSGFYPGENDLKSNYDGQTFEQLYEFYKEKHIPDIKANGYNSFEDWAKDSYMEVYGFWIIEEQTLRAILQIWPVSQASLGNDSIVYALNYGAKKAIQCACIKTISRPV